MLDHKGSVIAIALFGLLTQWVKMRKGARRDDGELPFNYLMTDQEQPDVLPQPSQTKHEPAIRILVPQVMQSGASDD